MDWAITGLFVLAGVINLIPVVGVLSADRLKALYAVELDHPDLILLMRHRAVLFGALGGLLVAAAFVPGLRPAMAVAGLVSMLAFVVLDKLQGETGAAMRKIVVADWIGSAALVAAMALEWFGSAA